MRVVSNSKVFLTAVVSRIGGRFVKDAAVSCSHNWCYFRFGSSSLASPFVPYDRMYANVSQLAVPAVLKKKSIPSRPSSSSWNQQRRSCRQAITLLRRAASRGQVATTALESVRLAGSASSWAFNKVICSLRVGMVCSPCFCFSFDFSSLSVTTVS